MQKQEQENDPDQESQQAPSLNTRTGLGKLGALMAAGAFVLGASDADAKEPIEAKVQRELALDSSRARVEHVEKVPSAEEHIRLDDSYVLEINDDIKRQLNLSPEQRVEQIEVVHEGDLDRRSRESLSFVTHQVDNLARRTIGTRHSELVEVETPEILRERGYDLSALNRPIWGMKPVEVKRIHPETEHRGERGENLYGVRIDLPPSFFKMQAHLETCFSDQNANAHLYLRGDLNRIFDGMYATVTVDVDQSLEYGDTYSMAQIQTVLPMSALIKAEKGFFGVLGDGVSVFQLAIPSHSSPHILVGYGGAF